MSKLDILDPNPSEQLYSAIGQINFAWSILDALVSAAFVATLGGDAVEIGVTLGRLETKAKVEKLKKIYRHRKSTSKVKALTHMAQEIEALKVLRNAITHGFYLGRSDQNEYCWSILPEFVITDESSANELFVATPQQMLDHAQRISLLATIVYQHFDKAELRKLFDVPSRVRS